MKNRNVNWKAGVDESFDNSFDDQNIKEVTENSESTRGHRAKYDEHYPEETELFLEAA